MKNKDWAIDVLISELFKADQIIQSGMFIVNSEQESKWLIPNSAINHAPLRNIERQKLFEHLKNEGIQFCRKCGCTEHAACGDGCYWVEPDLCSACANLENEGEASW